MIEMSRESPLKRKVVRLDALLSQLLEQPEGTMVSYTEITKGVHAYIRSKGLKVPQPSPPTVTVTATPNDATVTSTVTPANA